MALTATLYTFTLALADADRGVYADLELRVAQHPSETAEFMLARVLAYCLEYEDGIAFTDGVAATDEPAVLVRDLTGRVRAWIEVGAPDAERLHRGAKRADRAAVYAHRDPAPWLAQLAGQRIHRAGEIPVHALDPGFLREAASALQRRNQATLSVTGRVLYLDLNGRSLSSEIRTLALS
ncbi:MAG: YaeQ family protein [Gammaproteobacteria bacterium]|nr:YaeQ family protein [Gammaproteobacteria bacterium]